MSETLQMAIKPGTRGRTIWQVITATIYRALSIALLAFASLVALFPLYFLFVTALKGQAEFVRNQLGPPMQPLLSSFAKAFGGREIPLWFLNSTVLTAASVLLVTLVSSLAAYAFARMSFRGRDALFNAIISLMVVPPVVMIIPLFVLVVRIGLVNTLTSVILVYVGLMLPFSIYMLTSFFKTVSQEIVDAAIVDGCSDFMVYLRIMLPLARPALTTLVIVNALFVWNELLVALVLLQKNELKTLMVGLTAFKSRYNMDVPTAMAGLVIATVPLILLYLAGQRHFIRGLVAGSLKE
jgi:ABC-type glycerol-3-phosphate transport system permease component